MPLKKVLFKAGVNKENTRYYNENGYYDCDKIRFRQGTPEVLGGWQPLSNYTYLGVCRSLWSWTTPEGYNLYGVGTNLKFYIGQGGQYFDITPIRSSVSLTNPFTASLSSNVVTVAHTGHGAITGDYVTFYNATGLGGAITASVLNQQFSITFVDANTYTITVSATATAGDTGHGGTTQAVYQINIGSVINTPLVGWGAGYWGYGTWGTGTPSTIGLRLWNQSNFGRDLIFGPRKGGMYYWTSGYEATGTAFSVTIAAPAVATANFNQSEGSPFTITSTGALPTGLTIGTTYYVRNPVGVDFNISATPTGPLITTSGTQSGVHTISPRALPLTALATASDVPTIQNYLIVSDVSRFVIAFGCNDYGSAEQDPMLIRWSDQEDAGMWTPSATNQAGSIRLSHGSQIVMAVQARQELVVFTDSSLYSMQYLGPPYVWGTQLVGDNISIVSQNAVSLASGIVYWMGVDKFYKYDGRVQTIRCDLRQYVFEDYNKLQSEQIFSGTNEGYNEVWWFYCSKNSTSVDKYVIYNYLEDIWYYGTIARTAWLDTGTLPYPVAATYVNNIVTHENGLNDNTTGTDLPINAYITTSEFDIDDGDRFGFVWRMLPDLNFGTSTAASPQVTMTLYPMQNSGSGYTTPGSVGGNPSANVTRTSTVPIEAFTGQVYVRVRGRQMAFKIESNQLDTTWQLGAMRLDIKPDGRK